MSATLRRIAVPAAPKRARVQYHSWPTPGPGPAQSRCRRGRVPALGLREIRMADRVVRLNVRAFIHNARQAAVWKIALRHICKAIEQLDGQITNLLTRVKKLEGKS